VTVSGWAPGGVLRSAAQAVSNHAAAAPISNHDPQAATRPPTKKAASPEASQTTRITTR
jgi:hypothetical protein